MSQFIDHTLPGLIAGFSPLTYLLVFLGGVLTSLGPCNLSMIPVIMGYVGGQQNLSRAKGFRLAAFFTLGSSLTFMLLGVLAALLGGIFGAEQRLLYWFVALVCFAIGLSLLGAVRLNLDFLTRLQPKRVLATGALGALLLGLVVGLAGSQCATPILVAVLGVAMAKGRLAAGAGLLFVYGLGRGVPIVLAGTFTGTVRALPALERWTTLAQKVAGCVLIGVGLYFIWMA
jgi:cytochrome c-type biogenesis protein